MTVIASLWRNDERREIYKRIDHLLSKKSKQPIRWLWAVGDSDDNTERILRKYQNENVTVIRADSKIEGDTLEKARQRTSYTASQMFSHITEKDDFMMLHESDLESPVDVVDQLLENSTPVSGWPVLTFPNNKIQFYDIWAFRHLSGRPFGSYEIRGQNTFEVASFGSCWIAPANLIRNRRISEECVVDLCRQLREEGVKLYVDPKITIVQPSRLWQSW